MRIFSYTDFLAFKRVEVNVVRNFEFNELLVSAILQPWPKGVKVNIIKELDRRFEEVRLRLNSQQRLAVESIEGPVLVVAGPGTGKTEILAARIATILKNADVSHESILCLTYTDAGTVAMRSRLLQFIGADAYRVEIFTFHAFCNLVIQENQEYFGFRSLTPVSSLEQFQYVREIIDSFPQDNPLVRSTGEIHYESDRLLALYGIMKKEGWSPDFIVEQASRYEDSLLSDPEYIYKRATRGPDGELRQKGELNEKKLLDMQRRISQLKAAAASFDDYQRLLRERGRYDFADMILWCIKAFRESPEMLARYQERYLYIMVDEFQDTSGSQYDLLMQLVDYWDAPNLFVVGDDDQSIYRFQGASIENIRRFKERYAADIKVITLLENHRSSQKILDASANLISLNNERLVDDKRIVAANPSVADLPHPPRLLCHVAQGHETVSVAEEIVRLLDTGLEADRIAVIYRNHSQSDEIIRYLANRGIPVSTRRRADLLREPLIEKLLLVLRYLAAELDRPHSGERMLFEMLHEPWFGIPPLSLANLSVRIGRSRSEQNPLFWREELMACVNGPGQGELFPDPAVAAMRSAGEMVEKLIRNASTMVLQELMHHTITELGILARALSSADRVWHLELLNTLFDFVRQECSKGPLCLSGLVAMLDDMRNESIHLPVEKLSYSGKGVNFLTAHGAKGLEFDYVFMLGCTSSAWDSASRTRTYTLPPAIWTRCAGSEEEESRRLFYVAMTRARRGLVISWSQRDNNDRPLEQSRFVAELVSGTALPVEDVALSDEALISFGLSALSPDVCSMPQGLVDTDFVDRLLEKYSLSVTHLNSYLRCPLAFYFNTVLRVPAPMNAAMAFGSAVHHALEQLFRKMLADPERRFPSAVALLEDFRWYMRRHEDGFTPSEYTRRMAYGESILPMFHGRHLAEWHKDVLVEKPYRAIMVDDLPLNGKMDRIELHGSMATVVDYKTGSWQKALKKLRPPLPDKVEKALSEGKKPASDDLLGGDYWRQAVFYRILLEHDPKTRVRLRSVVFEFVEPDNVTGEFHTASVYVSDDEMEIVKGQIRSVFEKIRNHQFMDGCGRDECEWCGFAQRYQYGMTR